MLLMKLLVLFGIYLKCNNVHSFSPQTRIDKHNIYVKHRMEGFSQYNSKYFRVDDHLCNLSSNTIINIYVDEQCKRDMDQLKCLRDNVQIKVRHVPNAGHKSMMVYMSNNDFMSEIKTELGV